MISAANQANDKSTTKGTIQSMPHKSSFLIALPLLAFFIQSAAAADTTAATNFPIMADVLARSKASDWRALDPQNTIYLELTNGRVVIELAPDFAPQHVANVKALAREKYFDGLAILRAQDNYVV